MSHYYLDLHHRLHKPIWTTNTTTIYATAVNANPLVYHLSSSDPWRASIALTDASSMRSIGHNVTLLLSIEGVQ